MKTSFALVASLAGLVSFAAADIGVYGQCGGVGFKGDVTCVGDTVCTVIHEAYSQCLPTPTVRAVDPVIGYAALDCVTTGGSGGTTVRVSTLDAFKSAITGNAAKTVIITASLTGAELVLIGPNTSILGANGDITLNDIGLWIVNSHNIIIRNLKISKVLATTRVGDAIGIRRSSNIWIDHVDLSSDMDHDPLYYGGLIDITHGCTNVTVSWSYLHDHWLASLIGHAEGNEVEDKVITVTYHHNYFARIYTRTPSLRYGTGHIYNNYFDGVHLGIDTRDGAQLLVENNVFFNTTAPMFSTFGGFAVSKGNDFGGTSNTAPSGSLNTVPYTYSLTSTSSVKSTVLSGVGAELSF